ncbi:hypothetical protein A4249_06890 [Brevundimonas sp. GW460-12-10-14-LB2]|jgi:hypothetical protein|uniref:hypothetical protein n=1 Tax=Brevundimonas sp. GW460-12-10-14-LB2 TaxID=1827469 RepID=UPI0007BCB9E4|nr:hypothetical protein [Brevundimonas sp. GW460-12-10-14-LB2]ANC53405.1 hypothetical protein A4249_06890 [Brevundimonas sp. GW460-12-10-14-LB2]
MTHHAWVVLTGMLFLSAGGVMTVVFRLLGPTYHTRISGNWFLRLVVFLIALFLMVRGATTVFPGRLVRVEHMSPLLPVGALVSLAFSMIVLDFVQRDRSPPPWSIMAIRLFTLIRREDWAAEAAMKLPPAGLLDRPISDQPHHGLRITIVGIALVLILAAALTIAINGLFF